MRQAKVKGLDMTTHVITADMLEDKGYGVTVEGLEFSYTPGRTASGRYRFGFNPEGRQSRKVYQGPLVTDRFGWLGEQCSVIALHPLVKPSVVPIDVGDVLSVEGHGDFLVTEGTRFDRRPQVETI